MTNVTSMARMLELCMVVFALFCSYRGSSEPSVMDRFLKFINDFKKPYENGSREFELRLANFKVNLQRIEELNEPYGEDKSAVYGITKFSDLSQEEFGALYLNDLLAKQFFGDTVLKFHSEKSSGLKSTVSLQLPQKIDWRDVGAVSAIKNQGNCGACWAFAVTESVESAFAITFNTSAPKLAVQQLIDCSTKTYGCEGGDICAALSYVQTNGITYDENYPLTDSDGICHILSPEDKIVKIAKYRCNSYVGKEDQILQLLGTVGPMAVAVDASTWNNYVGGIIRFHCEGSINHAVDIIGYDLTGEGCRIVCAWIPYHVGIGGKEKADCLAKNVTREKMCLIDIVLYCHQPNMKHPMNSIVQEYKITLLSMFEDSSGPVPYYIVRNSWGTDFGMDGYMYIEIGNNLCGIAEEVADLYVS